jgi:hypothetical protein
MNDSGSAGSGVSQGGGAIRLAGLAQFIVDYVSCATLEESQNNHD